jgi:cupin superfamily acireductone dioxygenase involved in methionine salvage
MIRKDICDCINSEDKEPLMLALNESIKHEEEKIIKFKTGEEKIRKLASSEKYKSAIHDIMNLSDKVQKLHEYTINYYKKAKTKLENTRLCDK